MKPFMNFLDKGMDDILMYVVVLMSVAAILYCNIRFGSPYDVHSDDPNVSAVEITNG